MIISLIWPTLDCNNKYSPCQQDLATCDKDLFVQLIRTLMRKRKSNWERFSALAYIRCLEKFKLRAWRQTGADVPFFVALDSTTANGRLIALLRWCLSIMGAEKGFAVLPCWVGSWDKHLLHADGTCRQLASKFLFCSTHWIPRAQSGTKSFQRHARSFSMIN